MNPGDKVALTLENDLSYPTQADISWTGYEYDLATTFGSCEPYRQPNMTSLHSHGMLSRSQMTCVVASGLRTRSSYLR